MNNIYHTHITYHLQQNDNNQTLSASMCSMPALSLSKGMTTELQPSDNE